MLTYLIHKQQDAFTYCKVKLERNLEGEEDRNIAQQSAR
jgi:hypothetical protein